MPESGDTGKHQREMIDFAAAVLASGPYAPPSELLTEIRGYLTEIQTAIQLLPDLDGIADGLEATFDPAWPGGTA